MHATGEQDPAQQDLRTHWLLELQTKVLKDFTIITEKARTRAFSWLKAATTAFTFKTLIRHYAKQALTPRSLNVILGPRRKGHKGRTLFHVERPWGQRPFSIVS